MVSDVAVTYESVNGRFGDHLVNYLHAKWISYLYGYRLLYKPFLYSEEFALNESEELWTEEKERNFDRVVKYQKQDNFLSPAFGSLLFLIPSFSPQPDDRQYHQDDPDYFPVGWKDEEFRNQLRAMFRPVKEYPTLLFPQDKDYLTVAVHVRRGGDYDPTDAYLVWPLRFPPDTYYIECLKKLCFIFPERPIYAFVFTDDLYPAQIVAKFKEKLGDFPILFDCRTQGNRHDAHVMEDFFAMLHFNCLIRSASNFTLVPAVIGDYQVIMTPKHNVWRINNENSIENYIDEIDEEKTLK